MGGAVVQFESARQRDLRVVALQLIEELGAEAGYRTALFARLPTLAPEARERLLAVAELIEREQGFGWYLAEEFGGQAARP